MARPSIDFDSSRYFRADGDLGFYNVGTAPMRLLARRIYADRRESWGLNEAMGFANLLIQDRYLEVKSLAIEVLARYRREFTPRLLPAWKRWLKERLS